MEHLPILIPIKEHSNRCLNKNKLLLPYTLNWLTNIGRINDTVVITDSDIFKEITDKYPISEYYIENRKNEQDELVSLSNYIKNNQQIDKFVFLPVTQPLRENDLIDRMANINLLHYDMVTSYNVSKDRSIFEIEGEQFKFKNIERKGCLCNEKCFADGACYILSKSFLNKVAVSKLPNKTFWSGKIKFIENNMPQLDIDTISDLNQFNNIIRALQTL